MVDASVTPYHKNKWLTSAGEISGRTWMGLFGVFLAVMASGVGENASKFALADIQGGMSLSLDAGSWITTCYVTGFVIGSGFTPCFWPTFSLRRVALTMSGIYLVGGLITPWLSGQYPALLAVRSLQGFAGGALPPMLMTVVLRFMPPLIKVLGLGAYGWVSAWSATLGATAAAFAFHWGWSGYFYWNLPLMAIAAICMGYGLPQDPLRLERLRQFNWRGLLLGGAALGMLTTGISQGERLDWFNSPLIYVLLLSGVGLLALFLINEWFHPLPFFNLQLLKKRNLSFSLITLGGVLLIMVSLVNITSGYLAAVQGYRQEQTSDMMLWVALPQLITLPIIAIICNTPRVDCRWVLAISLLLMATACLLAAQLTPEWNGDSFHTIELLQAVAQPMAIIPLLMQATGGLLPTDGPFAAAWFNAVKGFAATAAGGAISLLSRQRGDFHAGVISDSFGSTYRDTSPASTQQLSQTAALQGHVLASADLYMLVAGLALLLTALILFMPTRIYPPRSVAA
ncbi:Multidrug resistance protein B [Serratia proteamaculans]|uniref:MFS transporter n=1 Tax=Serratia proteamaculans TaxID=28151 RepID=A0ABS0TR70_SERPR|nr:MFS transporter [Serratia proteamaculans]KAB1494071.1 multidrug efflux MFS transporter [Serratia proteamaculans]MBI6180850.1 MFS transporter [Serratia proteamaculans]RYM54924.1 MFS transporter [Serratia proteamaculans]CAI1025711.1 Multidrug resistance protein B [Serratia proteamaculans]CAI1135379.1 Multidrug resistance protein B [Serratia proteamaculans]